MCPLGACSQRVHPQKRPSFLLRGVLHACGIAGRRGRLLPCLLGALRHDALVLFGSLPWMYANACVLHAGLARSMQQT